MYLKYGDYSHSTDECAIVITKESVLDDYGRKVGYKEMWNVSGMLTGSSVSAVTTAIQALETAYSVNGRDLKLLQDDGTETAHKLVNADSLTGVRIKTLGYPAGAGAEYTTFRNYQIVAEADFSVLPGSGSDGTIRFQQTISYRGTGGPRKVIRTTLTGMPVAQQVAQRTPIFVSQSGFAIGFSSYPAPAAPILPQWEDFDSREIEYVTPQMKGLLNQSEYRINWTYRFSMPG